MFFFLSLFLFIKCKSIVFWLILVTNGEKFQVLIWLFLFFKFSVKHFFKESVILMIF